MASGDIKSSKGASVFFGICFIVLLVIHVVLMLWKQSWHMLWLIIGTILELSAFFSNNAGNGVQSVQVIIAPIFIAASVYFSFSGLLKKLEIPKIGFNRRFQSFLFIIGDIISFGLQIAGVVLQMIEDDKSLGQGLIITGFIVQIVSFCCFFTLVIAGHRKVNRMPLQSIMKGYYSWRTYFKVLYVLALLFFIRNIFRLVEYAQGYGGYIFNHAVYAYIFDAAPMLIVCILLVIVHPGFVYAKVQKFMMEPRGDQEDDIVDKSSIEMA
ncbi:RTA1 like family protein [Candida parapsilosis]|uniref:RTA1 like protein n=2 Tax=Candida parapsilosis TaxID=5480 RepID=G8B503_CANPC|nr:uncharacterized protein CPAR2_601150 [Candida parapsilosis]KAF6043642.1 RTA1 like family protein [Candida parapsilosis]KAF6043861.1 RTA1 like family protein [Candida parapsilosis]KAF6045519.1 RTA1 like family protein [Candida parapsilosis]KAF6060306.1 RTA1 like family protein [Candida parapsilosis]KAI5905577.1 Protoporphyrin uptake protein 1 [Candida parapsilosis]